MHRVGLCMIVKNEAHVIERCLNSVRPYIGYWTIIDTGSTDGTQDVIRRVMADMPGQLLERPWVDFGHNRTEALIAAREHAEYSWIIDADEIFEVEPGFTWPVLRADAVLLTHRDRRSSFQQLKIVANRVDWRYRDVIHEYLSAPNLKTTQRLKGAVVMTHYDGGRSKGLSSKEKYARDVVVLEDAVANEPDHARYAFYLAQSYNAAGRYELALVAYRRRVRMGGFAEEVATSLLWIAQLLRRRKADPEEIVAAYLAAWEYRPTRAEPLVHLAAYYRENKRFALGRLAAMHAMTVTRPRDMLCLENSVYEWRCDYEYAVCSVKAGHLVEGIAACRKLLAMNGLPAEHRPKVVQLLAAVEAHLAKQAKPAKATTSGKPASADVPGTRRPVESSVPA